MEHLATIDGTEVDKLLICHYLERGTVDVETIVVVAAILTELLSVLVAFFLQLLRQLDFLQLH